MSLTKFLFCFEPISAGVINIAEGIRYNVTFARGIRQRHHFYPGYFYIRPVQALHRCVTITPLIYWNLEQT